ncbi:MULTISPECIES: trigger factor [unclassified Luteococcus]|uniref:trigger factor n=1 Tax=unclassified Luteococcus TaxID=2639923 RepID=UPI00313C992F
MPSTVEQLSPSRVKLTIDMPFEELKPSLDKAYAEIAQQVTIPGFRKGKVPAAIIDQRFGRGMVLQEAINDALPNAYGQAVVEHELVPLGQPEIDVTNLEDGKNVQFTAEVDVRPAFDLPAFDDISVEVDPIEVNDDDFNQRLDMLRERFATNTDVERAAQTGDLVTVDLEGSQNGEVLEDATAEGIQYKVGSGGMLEGMDEAIIGLKAGESKTFTSQLLGGGHKDEQADIKVTVTKVQEQELPEVDDEFAQMISQFDTADEMRADMRSTLENMARLEQAADARDKVLEAVIAKTDFELPKNLVDAEIQARKDQVNQQLAAAGLSVEQYLADAEDETAETEDEFWAEIEKRSMDALKAQIVLDKLADDEEFEVGQEELTQMIFTKAQQNNTSPEQEIQHMQEHNHLPEWMQEIRRSKALAKMVNEASIADTAGATVDLTKMGPDGALIESDEDDEAEAKPAKKAPAKKAPAKKAAAKPADEAPAEEKADEADAEAKPAAKKTAAKKAPAKKTAAKKAAPAEDKADEADAEPAKKAPAKKTAAKKAPAKKTAAKKAAPTADKAEDKTDEAPEA